MKKILAFLLIVAMMFVVLCSCGSNGTDGTNGKDGIDGKSAYELAVENGFNGTVEEWLSSLVGEKGSEGKDGKTAEFRVNDYWLQWKYTDETVWNNICLVGIEKIPEGGAKVEFYLDGGAMPTGTPTSLEVTSGTSIVLPTPSKAGYSFVGWFESKTDMYPVTTEYRVHGSVNLYARWEEGYSLSGTPIYTVNDLAKIKNDLGGTYVLMNDIDCGGMSLQIIGLSSSDAFRGLFDGQGYTISNFTVPQGNAYVGLFG